MYFRLQEAGEITVHVPEGSRCAQPLSNSALNPTRQPVIRCSRCD